MVHVSHSVQVFENPKYALYIPADTYHRFLTLGLGPEINSNDNFKEIQMDH